MNANSLIIGADIGGTHITAALVDVKKRIILRHSLVRESIDAHALAPDIIEAWSKAIAKVGNDVPVHRLSLALPGPFDYEKGISLMKGQGKYEHLYHCNVKEMLAERLQLSTENISMINDAAAFMQGEAFAGAAQGCCKAIGITLGTGLGTSIYRDGVAEDAGLWQMPFRGAIAEEFLCTRWFVQRFYELSGHRIAGVRELLTRTEQGLEQQKAVQQVFEEFGENLALFLKAFISESNPETVVLGGNITKAYHAFRKPLLAILKQTNPDIPIIPAQLGEEAALLGAVGYFYARLQEKV